ncbi:MAG: NUDIX hydrolase [Varibaculum sp.]|nr:NUDIX hydrolase [Varibaculum sp.]
MAHIADNGAQYPVEESKHPWRGAVFGIQTDMVRFPGAGHAVARDYLNHPGAVAILAEHDRKVMMVHQYRAPVGLEMWELPAGLLDRAGEIPLQAAQRELAEETGLAAATWEELGDAYTSPGCSTEHITFFWARELYQVETEFVREDEEALMDTLWVDLDEAISAARASRIHSAATVLGLLLRALKNT